MPLPSTSPAVRAQAVFWLLVATSLWGFSFALTKGIFEIQIGLRPGISGVFLAASQLGLRFLGAGLIIYLLWGRHFRGLTRPELIQGLGIGFFSGLGMLVQMDALNYIPASVSAFLTQAYCLFLPLLAAARERRWPRWTIWAATLCVLVGVGILAGVRLDQFHLGRGEIQTLLAAVLFTGHVQLMEERVFAENDMRRVTLVQFPVNFVLYTVVALATARSGDWGVWIESVPAGGLMVLQILLPTLGSFMLMNLWQRHVRAMEAGIIYSTEPISATLIAFVAPGLISAWAGIQYPNEVWNINLALGGGLILIANWLTIKRS